MNARTFCTFLLLVLLLLSPAVSAADNGPEVTDYYTPLSPSEELILTGNHIVGMLKHRHYLNVSFDDALSSKVFTRYFKELDPNRIYFLASDINEFEKYRYLLDDALRGGKLTPGFAIFNRYQQRYIERLLYLVEEVNGGLADFDFTRPEKMLLDRESVPWPADRRELDKIWRQRLKNSVLSLRLADKTIEEIEEVLSRRYRNQLNRAGQNTAEDAFQMYMNALTLSFDPHTQYFSPRRSENFDINMSLSLEGIGAVLQSEEEYTKVLRLVPAGPADKGKQLKPGARIVGVGQGPAGEIVDVVGWRLDEVVDLIRGPKGTTVRLEVIPSGSAEGQPTRVISIVRDTVKLEEQAARKEVIELDRQGRTYRFGVIDIPTFYMDFKALHAGDPSYKSTTTDVRRLLHELREAGVDGIILDLRDNGGGSLQEANSLVGLFISRGPTVQVKGANGRVEVIRDRDEDIVYEGPLVVLVNRLSASASEIFAGAIQDYRRGLVIGEQTFGKGTVQALLPLNHGQLKTTSAKYYRISGESTQHKGVLPDLMYPSLYDKEEIGESALPEALPWDQIEMLPHQRYFRLEPFLGRLSELHRQRIKMSPDYYYLLERIQRLEEMRQKKEISLNEEARRQERKEADEWLLALENKRRRAKDLEPVASLDEVESSGAGVHGGSGTGIDKDDPLLVEGGWILIDFITLFQQNVALQLKP